MQGLYARLTRGFISLIYICSVAVCKASVINRPGGSSPYIYINSVAVYKASVID